MKVTPFASPQLHVTRLVWALGDELASPMAVTRYDPLHGRAKTAESPAATLPLVTVPPVLLFLIRISKYFSVQGHTVKSSSIVTTILQVLLELDVSANYIQSFRTAEFQGNTAQRLHTSYLHLFRHIAPKFLDIRHV